MSCLRGFRVGSDDVIAILGVAWSVERGVWRIDQIFDSHIGREFMWTVAPSRMGLFSALLGPIFSSSPALRLYCSAP